MEWKRITVIAILQALVPITDADALGLADPKLCFILDGILLIYAIIITACFIKAKLSKEPPEHTSSQNADDLYNKLSAGRRDEYDSLGVGKADADIEMGGRKQHRRKQAQDKVYTRRRGKGTDTVYQGLSAATRDTYDVLQMQQLQTPY
nr:T-cell surface glycoprotein CD3 zeta chain isoform X3 [Pogona vitticeps]